MPFIYNENTLMGDLMMSVRQASLQFEWAHEAHAFAEEMRKYRLIVDQYGATVTIVNPFDTER